MSFLFFCAPQVLSQFNFWVLSQIDLKFLFLIKIWSFIAIWVLSNFFWVFQNIFFFFFQFDLLSFMAILVSKFCYNPNWVWSCVAIRVSLFCWDYIFFVVFCYLSCQYFEFLLHFMFCHNLSFASFVAIWVLSFATIWVFEIYQSLNFVTFRVLTFVTVLLGFVTIWIFKLCHHLSFWVK